MKPTRSLRSWISAHSFAAVPMLSPDADTAEKSFVPERQMPVISEPPRTTHGSNCFVRLIGWPAFVILGQLILQALGWTFFAIVKSRGQIALSLHSADWVKGNGHSVTLVVTLIATILAACSSFFFSYAIRRSLSLYLYRPMALSTLTASVNIASRAIVFRRWKWLIPSIFILLIAGIQTSGWTTLLTPVSIVISTPLSGSEVDLSSPVLKQVWATNALLDGSDGPDIGSCVQTIIDRETFSLPSKRVIHALIIVNYNALFTDLSESGLSATQNYFGAPTSIRFMNQTFNASTNGIMPAFTDAVNVSKWLWQNELVLPTIANTSALPTGLISNYSTIQQGFTADVSCTWQNLSATTTPPINETTASTTGWSDANTSTDFHITLDYYKISVACPMDGIVTQLNVTDGYTSYDDNDNRFMMVACKLTDRYSFLFVPRGQEYQPWDPAWDAPGVVPTLVCSLAPKFTTVRVDYGGVIQTTIDPSTSTIPDLDGPAALSAAFTMYELVSRSQSLSGSTVADQWTGMLTPLTWGDPRSLEIAEQYVKGVVEYSGSLFRSCLSATGNGSAFGAAGLPANATLATSGTYFTETIGWKYSSGATRWVLIPGALLAFFTIAIALTAVFQHKGAMPRHSFDPSNPLHLMGAAAAGDMGSAFREIGSKNETELNVILGWIPDGGPALVTAEGHVGRAMSGIWEGDSPYASTANS
ncbi:hypothetical protein K438DRAFT_1939919 [Mycena galopus ATCC 62051]|nr:hypothetical protein K438DRAFT_1939919 [Mycena galopus ATCC 62051]